MKKIILFLLGIVLLISSFGFAKPNVPSDSIPYVIITTSDAKSAYQVLADWKTKKGTPALVQTMSYIMTNYTGIDTAEKVRNYIKDMYNDKYTRWVLLGGDVSEVPTRYARVWRGSSSGDLNAISDYYYSCLDGDWNYDGDTLWGEMEDSVDLNPDVYVGRIPTSNPDTVSYVIDKLLSYEKDSPYLDYQTKALFLTSWINGDRSAQSLRDTLATYLPDWFTQVNLDEYSSDEGIDSLNSGFGLIVNYSMAQVESNFVTTWPPTDAIWNSDLDGLNNQHRYGVMLNSTCLNNKFDLDCISKHFILNPNGGLVGYIGTASLDVPRYTIGFHTGMFDLIFNQGETRIGKILTDSKLPYIDQDTDYGVYRRHIMTYLLLGDPQMEVWTYTPLDLTVEHPSVLDTGWNSFEVLVRQGGSYVIDGIVCLMKDDEVYEIEYTRTYPYPGEAWFDDIYFPTPGWATLVTSKKNYYIPDEDSILIGAPYKPDNLWATPWSCLCMLLYWNDNSSNEAGFKIERKHVDSSWQQIVVVDPNIEYYEDTEVSPETKYYYRVRAYNAVGNSEYSNVATAETPECEDPGCPFLYVWNGQGFAMDNVILTGSEDESIDRSSLTDYYILSQTPKPEDGKYDLELREFENEVSYIDHLSLFAIDYPPKENVGVTPQGKVWIYSDPVSPISCVDQDGDDHLNEILAKDGKCFVNSKPGYLILNFGKLANTIFFKPSGKMDSGGGGGIDPPPKTPSKLAPFRSGSKGNIVHVEVEEQNGDWKEVARVYPRTIPVISLVELSQYVDPNQEFKMKISWDKSYSTDHIAYYRFDDTEITITKLSLSSAFHSEDGNISTALGSIDDQSVMLSPDQAIGVSFIAFPDNPSKKRDFLLVAKGYYEQLETLPQRDPPIPLRLGLPTIDQNYPNPFNVATSVKFTLPDAAKVALNIYNILGQKVITLVDEEKPAGTHTVFWDGRDKSGAEVASGIYFYQLKAGDFKELKKMLLIK